MPLVLADRVRETTTVVGTNDATLLGAVTGFQSFAVVGNTNTCYYTIADNAGNWEVGIGTYSTTGPTLARTTVLSSSNAGLKVNFPAGVKDIFVTYPSEKSINLDESGYVDAAGSPNVSLNGNLTFVGTTRRITGDFSNATLNNRVAFQTSTTNSSTNVGFIPNGTGVNAQLNLFASSDPANASLLAILANSSINEASIRSIVTGTGTFLPLTVYTGGSERLRIDTSGNFLLGTTVSPAVTVSPPATATGTMNIGGAPAFYTFTTLNGASTTQYSSLFLQNSTPLLSTGSIGVQTGAISINTLYSHDASVGTAQLSARGLSSQPQLVSTAATATIQFTSGVINAQRGYSTDLSQNVSIEGIRTNFGHTLTLASTAISPNAIGVLVNGNIQNGSVTNAYTGVQINTNATPTTGLTSTITNLYGITHNALIGTSTGTATVTNFYGLYLAAPNTTPNGTITNRWGIFQADTAGTNYFGAPTTFNSGATFASLSTSGNLTFTGTGNRITGDFSNATIANRVAFQTSTVNGATQLAVIPNGTSTTATTQLYNNSDPTNAAALVLASLSTETSVRSGVTGSGSFLPLTMWTGGSEKLRIDTSGNVSQSAGSYFLVNGGGFGWGTLTTYMGGTSATNFINFITNSSERMRIDSSGNVGIGTSSPAQRLDVNGTANFGNINTGNGVSTGTASIELGGLRTGDGVSLIDFHSVSGTDYESRILRVGGVNGALQIINTGTGDFRLAAIGAAPMIFDTSSLERMRITSAGSVGIGVSTPSSKLTLAEGDFFAYRTSSIPVFLISSEQGAGYAPANIQMRRLSASGATPNNQTIGEIRFDGNSVGNVYDNMGMIQVQCGVNASGGAPSFMMFATASSGANATERMRIDSFGNVVVGSTTALAKLFAAGATNQGGIIGFSGNSNTNYPSDTFGGYIGYNFSAGGAEVDFWNSWTGANATQAGFAFRRQTGASSNNVLFYIRGDGNVGIGTTTPTQLLDVNGNLAITGSGRRITGDFSNATIANRVMFQTSTTNGNTTVSVIPNGTATVSALNVFNSSDPNNASFGQLRIIGNTSIDLLAGSTGTGTSLPLTIYTGGSERLRIDTSGNLLVATTTARNSGIISVDYNGNAAGGMGINDTASANGSAFIGFLTGGTFRGSITNNNNTAVAYNTTSDYRLKENIAPMTGALEKVAQLKPCTYTWKSTGEAGQGFIAHELAEVVPDAVSGSKDEVDDEGKPKYQGVDASFLVATLTAAIQEQQKMIEELTSRINKLEGV